ncbi:MAG TPA: hypothetical protein VK537_02830 [Galbitalea sp.]|nr:hypothetical protein [Galbitalea sp.]
MFTHKTSGTVVSPGDTTSPVGRTATSTAATERTVRAKVVAMLVAGALGTAAFSLAGTTAAIAAGDNGTDFVSASDIGSTPPTGSNSSWYTDLAGGGTATITTDAFDGKANLKLGADTPTEQARLLLGFGPNLAATQTNLHSFLAGSSYSYSGASVQFAVELYFTPNDEALYGPAGSSPCTQALGVGGSAIPGECYTTLKWDPLVASADAWTTVDLTAITAENSGATPATAGWKNTNRVGEYAKPGSMVGNTLDEYLAQIVSYQIVSGGVQIGTSSKGSGWVKDLKFNGATYAFGTEPTQQSPTPAPAASDSDLDQLIADDHVDVAADLAQFTPESGVNSNLAAVDASKPLSGSFVWQDPTDAFVDVYTYSSPTFVGTFPVVNGTIQVSVNGLAALASGEHHLVFTGQTSGTLAIVPFAITAEASGSLPVTGTADVAPMAAAAALLLLAGLALLLVFRGSRLRRG